MITKNKLNTVVFHYNPYNYKWYCIPRDLFGSYFNTPSKEKERKFGIGNNTHNAYQNYLTKSI